MSRRLAVIGGGLIGGSIALAARAVGQMHVTVTDTDPAVRARLTRLGVADVVADDVATAVADADVVFAAVPAAAVAEVLTDAARAAPATAALTDAASLKAAVVTEVTERLAAEDLGPQRFVGGHPMAGSERSGPDAADARLFQGATWVLTPLPTSADAVLAELSGLLRSLGARVLVLPPERHDEVVAVVSHLPQIVASTLTNVAADAVAATGEAVLAVAGGGFRDTTRIAASDPQLWVPILDGNRGAVLEALDATIAALTTFRGDLAAGDLQAVRSVLARASDARRRLLPKEDAAAVVDVVIPLDDQPGQLAAVTTALGEAGVNVEDLAMRHAPDGGRGALMVRVTAADARVATDVLAVHGIPARLEVVDDPGSLVSSDDAVTGGGAVAPTFGEAGRPVRAVPPLAAPPSADITVPGSKSLTNRALVAAALADGTSTLDGVLFADDTEAMITALARLGFDVEADRGRSRVRLTGQGGHLPARSAHVDVRLSGTTARFLAPLLALGYGGFVLDGAPPFRARPMGPVLDALRGLKVRIDDLGSPGHLPALIHADGLSGGVVDVAGDASSQFLSGLLLVGPATRDGLELRLSTPLVSEPYVAMTIRVMEAFGARVRREEPRRFVTSADGYTPVDLEIEPDASAATYFLAAAAITGGRVRVRGLTGSAMQGDAGFARVLERMGASVTVDAAGTEVRGTGRLHGIEVDLGEMSDTAQTLAAAAVFADAPTRITGIGFIRAKETDRIAAVVTELRRCGIHAVEEDDGLVVHPGVPKPAVIETYDDHRMAMSFALLGLVVDGIRIADPGCVDKTFPTFFEVLDELRTAQD